MGAALIYSQRLLLPGAGCLRSVGGASSRHQSFADVPAGIFSTSPTACRKIKSSRSRSRCAASYPLQHPPSSSQAKRQADFLQHADTWLPRAVWTSTCTKYAHSGGSLVAIETLSRTAGTRRASTACRWSGPARCRTRCAPCAMSASSTTTSTTSTKATAWPGSATVSTSRSSSPMASSPASSIRASASVRLGEYAH
jgi:hypothetical protein